MATEKTTTLTFRLEPSIKDALRIAADREHRSITNMVAVMIRDYCARAGIPIQNAEGPPTSVANKPKLRQ